MLNTVKTLVISYDCLFYLLIVTSVYLVFYKDDIVLGNKMSIDRIDPNFMTKKELFSLLDKRGEVYSKKADKSQLVTLAKTRVTVEESDPPMPFDLKKLSITELKHLLDQRGLMYYHSTSKEDLVYAVNISGPVSPEAIDHMNRIGEPPMGDLYEFNAFNIDRTLEQHNESIFLINILPPNRKYSYFNESSWKALRRKLTYVGFKFGELDCDFERSICLRLKWNASVLYLYVPGDKEKTQYNIEEDYSIHFIFSSIQSKIGSRITHISSWDTFTSSQWAFYSGPTDKKSVRVILFTNMTAPPLFLSALAVKYRDKVNFGMVNMASRKGRSVLRRIKQTHWPLCLIVTKHGILAYGALPKEYFTYRELDIFLDSLLKDFKPVNKWHYKLFYPFDASWIGRNPFWICLIVIRFVLRFILNQHSDCNRPCEQEQNERDVNEPDKNTENNGCEEERTKQDVNEPDNDTENNDSASKGNDNSRYRRKTHHIYVDSKAVELILTQLLRRRNVQNDQNI